MHVKGQTPGGRGGRAPPTPRQARVRAPSSGAGVRVPDFLTAISALLVFPLPGRDRDAAVVSGGYIGFAPGAMPIGLGTMRRLADILGPAPRAFLIITLAASLFTDTANAVAIQVFRSLLG